MSDNLVDTVFFQSTPDTDGQSKEVIGFLMMCKNDNITCGIFHEPIHSVEIENLPSTWSLAQGSCNSIQLECQHCFNLSALMIHFTTNSMSCPICRGGSNEKVDIQSLPAEMKETFTKYAEESTQRNIGLDEMAIHLNSDAVNQDWSILVNVFCPGSLTVGSLPQAMVVSSRLHVTSANESALSLDFLRTTIPNQSEVSRFFEVVAQNDDHLRLCTVQCQMTRKLKLIYESLYNSGKHNATFQILLHHPMLSFQFSSRHLDMSFMNNFLEMSQHHSILLEYNGLTVGCVVNRNTFSTEMVLSCHNAPTMRFAAFLHIDVLLQCVMSEIQEQLEHQFNRNIRIST